MWLCAMLQGLPPRAIHRGDFFHLCSKQNANFLSFTLRWSSKQPSFLVPTDLNRAQESKGGKHQRPLEKRQVEPDFVGLAIRSLGPDPALLPDTSPTAPGCLWEAESSEPCRTGSPMGAQVGKGVQICTQEPIQLEEKQTAADAQGRLLIMAPLAGLHGPKA